MRTDSREREYLFQTPVFSRQLIKFIQGATSGRTREEIGEFFSDVKSETITTTICKLVRKGMLEKDESLLIKATEHVVITGDRGDRLWQAARQLKKFTYKHLCCLAEVEESVALDYCATWLKAGFITRIGSLKREALYRMDSQEVARPRVTIKYAERYHHEQA